MSFSSRERIVLKILSLIDKPVKPAEISLRTGLSRGMVHFALRRLLERGLVVSTAKGYYTTTKKGKEMPEFPKIEEGTVLGERYELETLLGKGTYGEVWKATDKSLERTVAVKLLHGGKKDFDQLKTEGKALSALTQKNILIVHDLGSDEENGWLVTEFIEGPSLHAYLAEKGKEGRWIPSDEAISIIEQCLEALEFAHEKKRVHGDIKPANIFVPKTGEIKLGDFGVAKVLSTSLEEVEEYPTGYRRRLGSPTYMAPEVLNDQPRSFQSDLFSVGILAYILFTGQHPFMHKSGLVSVPELIRSPTYVPPKPCELKDGIPEKYEKIILRLLEKDVDKRYATARAVLDDWREKIETVQCPECNAENPITNKFCGQCGSDLREIGEVESEPEKDLHTSFLLFRAGRPEEAIRFIQRSLDNNPNFAEGWAQLGYMLNHERRYEEAEGACTKSIKIDSESSRSYHTRGFARSNLGKFPDAIEDFTIAYEKETDERRKSLILYQRGYSKKLSGDFEGALEDAIAALELDETNIKAKRLQESVEPLVGIS